MAKGEKVANVYRWLLETFPEATVTMIHEKWGFPPGPAVLRDVVYTARGRGHPENDLLVQSNFAVTVVRQKSGDAIFYIKHTHMW